MSKRIRLFLLSGLVLILLGSAVGVYQYVASRQAASAWLNKQIHMIGVQIDPFAENHRTVTIRSNQLLFIGNTADLARYHVDFSIPQDFSYTRFAPYKTTTQLPTIVSFAAVTASVTIIDHTRTTTFTLKVLPKKVPKYLVNPDVTEAPVQLDLAQLNGKTVTYAAGTALLMGTANSTTLYSAISSNPKVALPFLYIQGQSRTQAIHVYAPGTTKITVSFDHQVVSFTLNATPQLNPAASTTTTTTVPPVVTKKSASTPTTTSVG